MYIVCHKIKLEISAELADRFHISDRAFGAIALGVLADVGLIDSKHTDLIIDRSKASRARKAKRKAEEDKLYFDGTAVL